MNIINITEDSIANTDTNREEVPSGEVNHKADMKTNGRLEKRRLTAGVVIKVRIIMVNLTKHKVIIARAIVLKITINMKTRERITTVKATLSKAIRVRVVTYIISMKAETSMIEIVLEKNLKTNILGIN